MKVRCVVAADSSGYYRIRQPIEWLRDIDVEVLPNGLPLEFDFKQKRFIDCPLEPDVDIIVWQRPMASFAPAVIDYLKAVKHIKVVVELDDDFHTAHPQNTAFQLNHPKRNTHYNWHHLGQCVRRCDLVVVSTPALAERYGSHGRVAVVRNSVDDDWIKIPRAPTLNTVGWPGTTVNHPLDPQATSGGVALALDENPDWRFRCVGGAKYDHDVRVGFSIADASYDSRYDSTDWKPLDLHPLLVRSLELGVAPLHLSKFNAAKSCLKGMEMAALGIPFVASPTPEYQRLHDEFGVGLLAGPKSKEWRRALSNLMGDEDYRAALGAYYRTVIAGSMLASRNAWRFAEAWSSVL